MTAHDKAIVGGLAAFLSSLAVAHIDWTDPSGLWVPHFLMAAITGFGSAVAVWITPNKPKIP